MSDSLEQTKAQKHAANQREWRAKNPERWATIARASRKKWRARNVDRDREIQRTSRHQCRQEILQLLGGGKCAKCGYNARWEALQIDHIKGDGRTDKTARQQVWWLRSWVQKNLEEAKSRYQVLCANCNWIKRHENREAPGNHRWRATLPLIEYRGKTLKLNQWAKLMNVPYERLYSRFKRGQPVEVVLQEYED